MAESVTRGTMRLASAALLALVLAGCGGSEPPLGAGPGPSEGSLTTSVLLAPAQPSPGAEFGATFAYTIDPPEVGLGAYQVRIEFDPALVRFVVPGGLVAGRIVNTLEAERGAIVVAGASSNGFGDGILFAGRFAALSPGVTPANFRVSVVEATDSQLASLLD